MEKLETNLNAHQCPECKTNVYLVINYNCPPIPVRDMDISIYCSNCYDVDWDGEETGFYSRNLIGYGSDVKKALENWNDTAWENEET